MCTKTNVWVHFDGTSTLDCLVCTYVYFLIKLLCLHHPMILKVQKKT